MEVHVSLAGPGDHAARVYRQLRDAILDGRLRPGERLPATRALAGRLAVARNTVTVAYERLTAEGFVTARVGAGTFVAAGPWTTPAAPAGTGRRAAAVRPRPVWRAVAEAHAPPAGAGPSPRYDFRVGTPDPALFPFTTWRRLVADELRSSARPFAAGYADPAGHAGLRAAIARSVGLSRSVRADADDILVTQGAQQAIDLLGRVLVEPGDVVAVEEPGYPAARLLFQALGARVVGVPVDGEGLSVAALPATARLVYVTPSHQFPLGLPMSPARRAALLAWAAQHDAVLVEDDYDSEFRFGGRPLEPLHSLDRAGRVVYVGTFSKTLLPMLRLGFLVAPASLRSALRAAKRLTDWQGDLVGQAALARLIDSGELARHVRRATRVYAARHTRLGAALRAELADWLVPVPAAAGLHLAARLRPGAAVDLPAGLARAAAAGIAVESLASYGTGDRPAAGLVLGYGAIAAEAIPAGVRHLAAHLAATTTGRRNGGPSTG